MSDHQIPEMEELREEFRAMASREIATDSKSRRKSRPHRRVGIVALAGLAVAGGVAGGSQLISTGSPESGPQRADRYRPGSTHPALVLTAPDDAFRQPWGVQIYDSRDGQKCALIGQVRGRDLGIIQAGRFHRYAKDAAGVCGYLDHAPLVYTPYVSKTFPKRLLVYGRARAKYHRVRLNHDGEIFTTRVGPGGAFLFVLSRIHTVARLGVTVVDVGGRSRPR